MADRAVVFDAMGTLFTQEPVQERIAALGAPEGAFGAWFERILHSAAALTLAGRFVPFPELAASCARTAFAQLGLGEEAAAAAVEALSLMEPYPEASAALDRVAAAGARAAVLTNGSREQTERVLRRAGLLERFDAIVTVAEVERYKPHPEPYRHAARSLALPPESLLLVAAHAWDVVGARGAGLQAAWVDRLERVWPFPGEPEAPAAGDLVSAVEALL